MKKLAVIVIFLTASMSHAHDPSVAAGVLFKGLVTPISKSVKQAIKKFKKHQKKSKKVKCKRIAKRKPFTTDKWKNLYRRR